MSENETETTNSQSIKEHIDKLCNLGVNIINYIKQKGFDTPLDPSLLRLASIGLNFISSAKITNTFIGRSYKYWDKIQKKDETFLIENCDVLFNGLDQESIKNFSNIFAAKQSDGTSVLPIETKESIWELLKAIVCNCIRHIHKIRSRDPISGKYTVTYISDISVRLESKNWAIDNLDY